MWSLANVFASKQDSSLFSLSSKKSKEPKERVERVERVEHVEPPAPPKPESAGFDKRKSSKPLEDPTPRRSAKRSAMPLLSSAPSMSRLDTSKRQRCWHWDACYRNNPQHKEKYIHPGDHDAYQIPAKQDPRPNGNSPVAEMDEVTSLEKALRDPHMLQRLGEHQRKEFNLENLSFWLEVDRLQHNFRLEDAELIFNKYIGEDPEKKRAANALENNRRRVTELKPLANERNRRDGAKFEVNLPGLLAANIRKAMARALEEAAAEPESCIIPPPPLRHVSTDIMPPPNAEPSQALFLMDYDRLRSNDSRLSQVRSVRSNDTSNGTDMLTRGSSSDAEHAIPSAEDAIFGPVSGRDELLQALKVAQACVFRLMYKDVWPRFLKAAAEAKSAID